MGTTAILSIEGRAVARIWRSTESPTCPRLTLGSDERNLDRALTGSESFPITGSTSILLSPSVFITDSESWVTKGEALVLTGSCLTDSVVYPLVENAFTATWQWRAANAPYIVRVNIMLCMQSFSAQKKMIVDSCRLLVFLISVAVCCLLSVMMILIHDDAREKKSGKFGRVERGKSYGTNCLILHSSPFTNLSPHTRCMQPADINVPFLHTDHHPNCKTNRFFSFFAFHF
jgi:hypothetical protein